MTNKEISQIFYEIADLLEIKGANPFRIRAYRKAAQTVGNLTTQVQEKLKNQEELEELPGIGKDLAGKIRELTETCTLQYYKTLKKEIPPGLVDMLLVPDLGPKTIKTIYTELNISTIAQLQKAAKTGKLSRLPGIKDKTEQNILKGIQILKTGQQRTLLPIALDTANKISAYLKTKKEVKLVQTAGSVRRRKDTVKDIDILVVSQKPKKVIGYFTKADYVKDIKSNGETKSSITTQQGINVDLRVVGQKSFGSALLYFTGSKEFNVKLRHNAIQNKYKINEYGIFKTGAKKERRLAGKTEDDIFRLMGMQYIPPVLRENRGEVEASLQNALPELVTVKDIKGDFHIHSNYSDGKNTISQIAKAAHKQGYKYIAISDHSQRLKIANGLDKNRVLEKLKEIDKVNKKLKNIRVFSGTEVDILNNGNLDYSDSILQKFDIVIASIHSGFKQSKKELTKRIVTAIKTKKVNIIGHPTGRLFGVREPYQIDLDEILKACLDYNVALEINAFPQRLDLTDINAKIAKEKGIKLALGSDAHSIEQLPLIKYGIHTAQRGWLEKENIINTLSLKELKKWLDR